MDSIANASSFGGTPAKLSVLSTKTGPAKFSGVPAIISHAFRGSWC